MLIFKENMNKSIEEIQIKFTDKYMNIVNDIFSYQIKNKMINIDQEKNILYGMDNINTLINRVTNCSYIKKNITLFDNLYKHIVNQLLEKGWLLECKIRPSDKKDFIEIIGPVIPCIEGKDDLYQIIYAVIEKNGNYSDGHPYDNYYNAFYPIIYLQKKYINHLNINLFEKVNVWFYYGYLDEYYDYIEDIEKIRIPPDRQH